MYTRRENCLNIHLVSFFCDWYFGNFLTILINFLLSEAPRMSLTWYPHSSLYYEVAPVHDWVGSVMDPVVGT
jgi:hypothetical protein